MQKVFSSSSPRHQYVPATAHHCFVLGHKSVQTRPQFPLYPQERIYTVHSGITQNKRENFYGLLTIISYKGKLLLVKMRRLVGLQERICYVAHLTWLLYRLIAFIHTLHIYYIGHHTTIYYNIIST